MVKPSNNATAHEINLYVETLVGAIYLNDDEYQTILLV